MILTFFITYDKNFAIQIVTFYYHISGLHQSTTPKTYTRKQPTQWFRLEYLITQQKANWLTHWGRVTHICVSKLTIIGSDNGLSPRRRQAIILTIAGILLIGPLGTNFSEILIGIQTFPFKKIHLKMSSAKWRPFVSASMCLKVPCFVHIAPRGEGQIRLWEKWLTKNVCHIAV